MACGVLSVRVHCIASMFDFMEVKVVRGCVVVCIRVVVRAGCLSSPSPARKPSYLAHPQRESRSNLPLLASLNVNVNVNVNVHPPQYACFRNDERCHDKLECLIGLAHSSSPPRIQPKNSAHICGQCPLLPSLIIQHRTFIRQAHCISSPAAHNQNLGKYYIPAAHRCLYHASEINPLVRSALNMAWHDRSVDSLGRQRSKRRRSISPANSDRSDTSSRRQRRRGRQRRSGGAKKHPSGDSDEDMDELEKTLGWRAAMARASRSPSPSVSSSPASPRRGGGGDGRGRGWSSASSSGGSVSSDLVRFLGVYYCSMISRAWQWCDGQAAENVCCASYLIRCAPLCH